MAAVYADRAFLSVNGVPVADIQSSSLRRNFNAKPVDTMTKDGWNRGFVQGNTHLQIGLNLAVQNTLARPKLDGIDYKANDVSISYFVGSDEFIALGVFPLDGSDESSGVGSESRFAMNFGATKLVDAIGNAVELFDIQLG